MHFSGEAHLLSCCLLPAGTLSNPFTGGSSRGDTSGFPPNAPHTMSYEDYLGRDEQWGDNRHNR